MGHLSSIELRERLGKMHGLRIHLAGNFYPPIPYSVRELIEKNFAKYWKKRFGAEKLLTNINKDLEKANGQIIGIKSLERFTEFLNEEDLDL